MGGTGKAVQHDAFQRFPLEPMITTPHVDQSSDTVHLDAFIAGKNLWDKVSTCSMPIGCAQPTSCHNKKCTASRVEGFAASLGSARDSLRASTALTRYCRRSVVMGILA
jgi:hypothetical protein